VNPRNTQGPIPLVRVAALLRYVRYLQTVGAPVGRLLAGSRIPAVLLDHPAAAVPIGSALRFGELACRALGTEHLGLYVGLESGLNDLGPFQDMLQRSLTLHEYLHKAIALYDALNSGQRLWLSEHGEELRFNVATAGDDGIGAYQSRLETLVVTIAKIREAAGPNWSPREVSLSYRTREDLPNIDLFAGSQILGRTEATYFTFPRALMGLRFPIGGAATTAGDPESFPMCRLPEDLSGLVRLQIETLLSVRNFEIETVAETLAISRRSLQRSLAQQGLTYSQVLAETRLRRAVDWLDNTDKPVGDIAFDLGYTDASNFTRAFRRQTGVSPQTFRDKTPES